MFNLFAPESSYLSPTSTEPILKGINGVDITDRLGTANNLDFGAESVDIDIEKLMPTIEDNFNLLLISDNLPAVSSLSKNEPKISKDFSILTSPAVGKDFLTGESESLVMEERDRLTDGSREKATVQKRSAQSLEEPGNNRRRAYKIGFLAENQNFSDSVSPSDRHDFYSFSINEPGQVKIKLSGLSDNADLYLRNSKGKAIAKSKGSSNTIEEINRDLEPGDYFLQVKSRNKRVSTDYDLELNFPSAVEGLVERSQTINFSLEDQSLWGKGEVFNPSINLSDRQEKEIDLGWLGQGAIGWEYNLEAFLSPGTFDVEFPALFEFDYPNQVELGSTVAVNFDSKLDDSQASLNVELGASLLGIAKLFLEYESDVFGTHRLEIGEFFNANKELLKNSPIVIDVGLGARTNQLENNTLIATDTAFQYIDVPNALAFAASTIGTPVAGEAIKSALKKAGLDARIGGNIKQESFLEIKGFEIDFDGMDNGNEVVIEPNISGTLNVPIPSGYSSGSSYSFSPTVTPIVEFGTEFSINGKAMGIFNFTKAIPFINQIPWFAARYVVEGETAYTDSWSPIENFDPFAKANFSANLPEISVEVI